MKQVLLTVCVGSMALLAVLAVLYTTWNGAPSVELTQAFFTVDKLTTLQAELNDKQNEYNTLKESLSEADILLENLRARVLSQELQIEAYPGIVKFFEDEMRKREISALLYKDMTEQFANATQSTPDVNVLENVIKVVGDKDAGAKLIDARANEYILSKGADLSVQTVDQTLLVDIFILVVASALGALIASAARQSVLVGYLLGGSIVGPGGLQLIRQFVQVETLAHIGIVFVTTSLGLQVDVEKLWKVRYVALLGGMMQLLASMAGCAVILCGIMDLQLSNALFAGVLISMSSSTVVHKSLELHTHHGTSVTQITKGLLVAQMLVLCVVLCVLPYVNVPFEDLPTELLTLLLRFVLVAIIFALAVVTLPYLLQKLEQLERNDIFLMIMFATTLTFTALVESILHTRLVGAFLSGLLISVVHNHSHIRLNGHAKTFIVPFQDAFGALFFTSIGMVMNPAFLFEQLDYVLFVYIAIVIGKGLIIFGSVVLLDTPRRSALILALELGHIGEFAFVLASDGLQYELLTSDQYLVVVGVTAISVLLTPFLFAAIDAVDRRDMRSYRA